MTLTELLVVVAIVAVVAALLFPVAGRVRQKSDDLVCLSNLRQIGLGLLAYAQDNSNRLPGPLYLGQYAYYEDPSQLSWHLRNYLNVSESYTKKGRDDVFVCPAMKRMVRRLDDGPSFALNLYAPFEGGTETHPPFGYPNSRVPSFFGRRDDTGPMRLLDLTDIDDGQPGSAASRTWAMQDIDREHPDAVKNKALFLPYIPAAPVHGGHRNSLFFDFHAGKLPITTQ